MADDRPINDTTGILDFPARASVAAPPSCGQVEKLAASLISAHPRLIDGIKGGGEGINSGPSPSDFSISFNSPQWIHHLLVYPIADRARVLTQYFGFAGGSDPAVQNEETRLVDTGAYYRVDFSDLMLTRGLTRIRVNTVDPRAWVAFSEIETFVCTGRQLTSHVALPTSQARPVSSDVLRATNVDLPKNPTDLIRKPEGDEFAGYIFALSYNGDNYSFYTSCGSPEGPWTVTKDQVISLRQVGVCGNYSLFYLIAKGIGTSAQPAKDGSPLARMRSGHYDVLHDNLVPVRRFERLITRVEIPAPIGPGARIIKR